METSILEPRKQGFDDRREKKLGLYIVIACITLVFLYNVQTGVSSKSAPITLKVFPEMPKQGVPTFIIFNLNNPSETEDTVDFKLYVNGIKMTEGSTRLPPAATKQVTYIYPDPPDVGERATIHLKSSSKRGDFEKTRSLPAYPPQVWSSFVSFASFSTSLISQSMGTSISSMQFYNSQITGDSLNVGLTFSMVLILLLVFLELSEPVSEKGFRIMGLRTRFSTLSAILFIVFIGMVFTKVMLIVG